MACNDPDVLIMDEPTRGIDVGAKHEIYEIMSDLAEKGKAIIMISSEMSELLGMADRICVMCNGKLTGEIDRAGRDDTGKSYGLRNKILSQRRTIEWKRQNSRKQKILYH